MPLGSLWLPGLVSAVVVFVLSSLLHMVLKYHRADYRQLAGEDAVADALRRAAPSPGLYVIPHVEMAQMKDPAARKRFEDGPVAQIAVAKNGPPAMGKYLGQWFLFCLLTSFVTAYVARHTLTFGAPRMQVLRITGVVSFVAYAFGYLQDAIWRAFPWPAALRGIFDALIYAVATAFIFHLLWPAG
jgi:hypothetical protein